MRTELWVAQPTWKDTDKSHGRVTTRRFSWTESHSPKGTSGPVPLLPLHPPITTHATDGVFQDTWFSQQGVAQFLIILCSVLHSLVCGEKDSFGIGPGFEFWSSYVPWAIASLNPSITIGWLVPFLR